MVIFWGRPAAGRRFHRRGAHPPQPFTTNAAFRDLWNHAAVARRRDADAPAVTAALPGCCGVFLPGDCAPLRWAVHGGPTSTSPRWPLAEPARPPSCALFQPRCQAHDCPATPLSPPGVLHQPHLFAGLRSSFFHCPVSSRQRAVGAPGISRSLCCPSIRPGLHIRTIAGALAN